MKSTKNIISSAPKESLKAAGLGADVSAVGGAGITSGGIAVALSAARLF